MVCVPYITILTLKYGPISALKDSEYRTGILDFIFFLCSTYHHLILYKETCFLLNSHMKTYSQ